MHIEEVNKIVLSSDDDKRLQTFERLQHIHTEQIYLKYMKVSDDDKTLSC